MGSILWTQARGFLKAINPIFECVSGIVMTKLYFGLKLPPESLEGEHIHCPLIAIVPFAKDLIALELAQLENVTHIILTSQVGTRYFFEAVEYFGFRHKLPGKEFLAVGQATAKAILSFGQAVAHVAKEESSEGLVMVLKTLDLTLSSCLWPCSSLSRQIIPDYLGERQVPIKLWPLYTTVPNELTKNLLLTLLPKAKELIFTSPSTVAAFRQFGGTFSPKIKITAIGPATAAAQNFSIDAL